MDEADDDAEEEDMEKGRTRVSEAQCGALALKTLSDTNEEKDARPEDRVGRLEDVSDVRSEKENSPEVEPEAEVLQDSEQPDPKDERQPLVRSEPKVQEEPDDQSRPELQINQEDRQGLEVGARSKVQAELVATKEQQVEANPEAEAKTEAQRMPEVQTEPEDHADSTLDDPKLPPNSQYFTSSQDFLDDDDIFLELAAAHQLLSESFDAGVRSQAVAQSSPVLGKKETIGQAQSNISRTTVANLPEHARPAVAAKPATRPTPSAKQQPESPVLERTPQTRMEFGCSGVSPELTSSNPFSQNQAALRSMSKPIAKPSHPAISTVMGPPTSITRPRTTLLTPIRSHNKNMPAPNVINSPSYRASRDIRTNGPSHRQPLNDISRNAQNASSKAAASSSSRSKPFLKPSLLPTHTTPKVSPLTLPTSTQLFLADHLDEFFPSPSQELRELLEDIEDDDIPSNTQVAREIGKESVTTPSVLVEPVQLVLDDDFPWMSSREFMFSSQELRELESPSKVSPVPAPPPTPWDVRRARKPRFFIEKEEDLFAAAIHESKLQGKADDEAAKLRLENMRIERELLVTRQSSQRHTPSARRASQDAVRLEVNAEDVSEQLEGLNASQLSKLMDGIESDEYGDDFDDEEAEASMIAFGHQLENPQARDDETWTESETESEIYESFIDRFLAEDAEAVTNAEDYYAFL
ncbi:hypothetical protein V491_07694 [Pseudogymnoascus sp. VKM F-3775]|nr:hypothetical protein V491_07694 [Pseudogymnoascus sp. VKM F-3775]